MVLRSWLVVAALLGTGCKQSLFDSKGEPDGGGGGPDGLVVPSTCPAPCIADAAADFDGTPGGMGMRWRYVDDSRMRAWVDMTASGDGGFVGADPMNTIHTCAGSAAATCSALPGALRISTAGATSAADPALGYTVTANQNIQLSVLARVPSGAKPQTIRLYRNSREDVLFTGVAMPDVTLAKAIVVDALAGDRFYVAVAPDMLGAADVALHFFISETGAVFPSTCQVAATFEVAGAGNTIANECGATGTLTAENYSVTGSVPPVLAAGPFPELGQSADFVNDKYYDSVTTLDKTRDTTVQLWVRQDAFVDPTYAAFLFSDIDLDAGGGLGIDIYDDSGPHLEVFTATSPNPPFGIVNVLASYPDDHAWHFVRAAQAGGTVSVCLDGKKLGELAAPAGSLASGRAPYLGRNVVWTPSGAFLDGAIDDFRVFDEALPCE